MRRPLLGSALLATALVATSLVGGTTDAHAQDPAPPTADPAETLDQQLRAARASGETDALTAVARRLEAVRRNAEAAEIWRGLAARHAATGETSAATTDARVGLARASMGFAEEVLTSGESGAAVKAAFEDARLAIAKARVLPGVDKVQLGLWLARSADALGELDAQIAVLDELVAQHAEDVRPRRALAFALLVAQQDARALELFKPLSEAAPTDLRLALGLCHVAGRVADESAQTLGARRAIDAAPTRADGWQALWRVYAPGRRYGELAAAVTEAASAHPDVAAGQHYSGFACSYASRFDDALTHLRRASELDPANQQARLEVARILREEKRDRDGAVAIYESMLAAQPGHLQAVQGLSFIARTVSTEDGHAAAVPYFEKVVAAQPDDGPARADLSLALRWSGRYDESDAMYRSAVEAAPDDAQIRNDYGLLLLVMRRDDDARRVFKGALEVDPLHNDGVENLAFMDRELGDLKGALAWFTMGWHRARGRGEDGARHRRTVDDLRWPLPPLDLR